MKLETIAVHGGYSPEGMGMFTVTAGKEHGRKLEAAEVAPESFRGPGQQSFCLRAEKAAETLPQRYNHQRNRRASPCPSSPAIRSRPC